MTAAHVAEHETTLENLEFISRMAAFVERKQRVGHRWSGS